SVVAESDSAGNIISRSHYEPFGKRLGGDKAGIGYTGHLQDEDLNLTYMQARYYDPLIGRFYSNDPIGFRDVHSFNRYAYANNNPYKYVDPDGEFAVVAVPIVVGIIATAGMTHQSGGKVKTPNITKHDAIAGVAKIAGANNPVMAVVSIILTAKEKSEEQDTPDEDKSAEEILEEKRTRRQETIDDYADGYLPDVHDNHGIERENNKKEDQEMPKKDPESDNK
ncbi:RHS repeat-associated core domain-containing protein, partial [Shewanella indica]